MFPAQALAEAMLQKGWRVRLSTDARGARYTGGFPHTTEIVEASSATFARGGLAGQSSGRAEDCRWRDWHGRRR